MLAMTETSDRAPVTYGHLLGGQIRYAQRRDGFRSGIEPILLAAAVPARPNEQVLEGGTGAGAALLCLAARVPAIGGVGVEQDPDLVRLATDNAVSNGFNGLRFVTGAIETVELPPTFDHACANPPFHDPAGTRSPDLGREAAKRGAEGLLAVWAAALGRRLRPRGTLTFILPAALLPACLEALATAGCPASAILPLWPKPGRSCKLMLVRGVKFGHAPLRLLSGLTLHRPEGGFTADTEAILRAGAGLSLD
jgi:tRNA1(Val) A37 N6-methylase TrmN6